MSNRPVFPTADALSNVASGLGTTKDKRVYNEYALARLTSYQLQAAYEGSWLPRKIVDVVAEDEVAEWRAWQADSDQIQAIEAEEARLGLVAKVCEARKTARLYGGAALWLIDREKDYRRDLDPSRLGEGGLLRIAVLGPEDITPGLIDPDHFPDPVPLSYTINGPDGNEYEVHPSRLCVFRGAACVRARGLSTVLKDRIFGQSVLQAIDDAIKDALGTSQGIATLMQESKIDVYRFQDLGVQLASAEGSRRVQERIRYTDTIKSLVNAIVIDKEDEWQAKQLSFTGLPDVLDRMLQIVAGAADIPLTRLLGQAPAGMNSTGESDLQNYHRRIASGQELELRPALATLDECLIYSALGSRPANIHYNFRSLSKLDDTARADRDLKKAQALQIYAGLGLIPDEALARSVVNMITEDGLLPGLEGEVENAGGIEGAPVFKEPTEEELAAITPPATTPNDDEA